MPNLMDKFRSHKR